MEMLSDKYADRVAELRKQGYAAIADMTRHFTRTSEMARGLGLAPGGTGVSKWLTRENNPSWPNEQKARNWLAANGEAVPPPAPVAPVVPTVTPGKPQEVVMMIVARPDVAAKAQRLLAVLGCEVIEV